ncbi:MAG: hypothetical protein ACLQGP_26940 [Isosphaeraceae bacterium]
MADRVFFIAGSPSELLGGHIVPPQMVEDLLVIAGISREALDRIAASLENAVGFVNDEELKQLVQEILPAEREVSAVLSAVQSIRPGRVERVLASLRDWRGANTQNAQRVPEEIFTTIQQNLTNLIREYPAWDRFQKARRLASLTGNKAQQVELICDVRPLFDRPRERIEGLVPLTTLKLIYETQTEETKCIELLLSADVLKELLEKANKVQQKLAIMRDFFDQWIPDGFLELPEQ